MVTLSTEFSFQTKVRLYPDPRSKIECSHHAINPSKDLLPMVKVSQRKEQTLMRRKLILNIHSQQVMDLMGKPHMETVLKRNRLNDAKAISQ